MSKLRVLIIAVIGMVSFGGCKTTDNNVVVKSSPNFPSEQQNPIYNTPVWDYLKTN
jgi:hypothetical protein